MTRCGLCPSTANCSSCVRIAVSTKKDRLTVWSAYLFVSIGLLLGSNSLAGANTCAGTAVDALVSVDYIDVASRDSLYGALADAGATSNTSIRNFVSHSFVRLICKVNVWCKDINFISSEQIPSRKAPRKWKILFFTPFSSLLGRADRPKRGEQPRQWQGRSRGCSG